MAKMQAPEKITEVPLTIIKQMIILSTSGFGVVVALAWNEVIKNFVESYVKPYLGQGTGVFSLFIYAVVVTVLAVVVTMQLSKIEKRLERENKEEKKK